MNKSVIIKYHYYGECNLIEVLEVNGVKKEDWIFLNRKDLEEFLVDYLADFHNGANYTLLREE